MADQKTKKELSTLSGSFRGWEKRFYEWNFSFFHLSIFSNFPKWRTKKHKNGTFYINQGFLRLRKTFLGMKIFIFSAQHIFRFSKMADQKSWKNELSTLPGGFWGWEKRFWEWKFSFFHPNIFSDFPRWLTKKLQKKNFLNYPRGFWGWEKRFWKWKFSFFHPKIFSDFLRWRTK